MSRRKTRSSPLDGELRVPGDKSISHRALLLSALARGRSTIAGPNLGEDVQASARAVEALGVSCDTSVSTKVVVEGLGWDGLHEPAGVIDAGNSGTTIRTAAGVCAGVKGLSILTGDESLLRRPMLRVVAPLRQMGATLDGRAHGDRPPLAIRGGGLEGIDIELAVASAQVKTALLLAGLRASGTTRVTEPGPSRDHTERMLAAAGVAVERSAGTAAVTGGAEVRPLDWRVPGDFSSAMFLIGAALLVEGSDLTLADVGLNPTRSAALDVLGRMGADLEVTQGGEWNGEPVGRIRVRHSTLVATEVAPEEIPRLVDEIPVLAVLASQAEGRTSFRGAGELRFKESDRIASLVGGLSSLGAEAEELPDGLAVTGPAPLGGGEVDCHMDHRIAMSFAMAGLVAAERVRVRGWSSVNTSFPEFLDLLAEARGRGR